MTTDLIKLAREIERENYSHNDVALLAQGYLDAVARLRSLEGLVTFGPGIEPLIAERDVAIARAEAAEKERGELLAERERWRNQFICVQCEALRACADEDGCCTACGMDCLVIEDGKLSGAESVKSATP